MTDESHDDARTADNVLAALSDPRRRQLLDLLSKHGEATATTLARWLPVSRQAVVKHLAILDAAGLVSATRTGREVRYAVRTATVNTTAQWMIALAADWDWRLANIKRAAEAAGREPRPTVQLIRRHHMETTALRSAYGKLLEAAAAPDLGTATDGGWNADQILAHLLSIDAGITAVALGVLAGARPTFDNRISLDTWNLDRIIADHPSRAELIDHVKAQANILCDVADRLSEKTAAVLVPSLLLSNDTLMLDQPIPLAGLINGLAENHVPVHTQQLLDLRTAITANV